MATQTDSNTHSLAIGYILWIFGFTGAHRFYFGHPITGTIWFFTFGVFLIGWLVDLFLMPSLDRSAEQRYCDGPFNYTIAWILLTFFGYLGIHRFYLGKWISGIVWFLTLGLFGLGWLYDLCTLNVQVDECNRAAVPEPAVS